MAIKNYKQKEIDQNPPMEKKKVLDYMTSDLITFRLDTNVLDIADTLLEKRITGAPVLDDDGNLIGLIDDKDCLRIVVDTLYHNQPIVSHTAREYMSNVMKTVNIKTDILEVANIFLTTPYKRLLVVDDSGKLRGNISRRDILRAIHDMS
ncbi:CBS domain-containing protein [Membranicola marinus]|uniref:CBS domain-containing protein n=1 Tax=Membranihabitans marinus TaxID=1227546 RepID=A0A953HJI2_9BACT|nr:CBS domain-containing protein [Membranihabitans marinus]MBY5957024.1 CBS domain-containing protein [Membranihabitans marinus]